MKTIKNRVAGALIIELLRANSILKIQSTVPVGTNQSVCTPISFEEKDIGVHTD